MLIDCDDDTVLVKVKRLGDGSVCHTGRTHAVSSGSIDPQANHGHVK